MGKPVEIFSTQGVPRLRKAERWNAILRGVGDALQVAPRDPLRFDGTLTRQRIGRLTLFEIQCASVRVVHSSRDASPAREASYQLLMPLQSSFRLTHGGRPETMVDCGSFCLIDRAEPYEMTHGDGLRAIGVEFPRSLLEGCLPQPSRHAGAAVPPLTGAGRVLAGMLRTLGAELSFGGESSLPPTMARSIAGFVAAAYGDAEGANHPRGVRARAALYRDYIDRRLGDGDLRPAEVARHFAVSERYVRAVFHAAGEPFSNYVLRRRLERAASMLRNEDFADVTVMHVAFECGFNNASHFGNSFRQAFGMSPGEWRRGGVPAAP